MSKLIKDWDTIPTKKKPLLAGTVGMGAATQFIAFCRFFTQIPSYQDIIANPKNITIPIEKDLQHAIVATLMNSFNEAEAKPVMTFIERMAIEFQMFFLKDVLRGKKELLKVPEIRQWITKMAPELM